MNRGLLTLATLIFCISCGTNKTDSYDSLSLDEKTELLRTRAQEYCSKQNDESIYDYYITYNFEKRNIKEKEQHGAFQNFHLITDSLKTGKEIISKAEISVDIWSKEKYKFDEELGNIFSTGLQFDIDSTGNITGHQGFIIFWNDKKDKEARVKGMYFRDDPTFSVAKYRKG
jgi:hypothetical protein